LDAVDVLDEDRPVEAPHPANPSRRLAQAAAAERSRLEAELRNTQNEAAALHHRLQRLTKRQAEICARLTLLDQLGAGEAECAPVPKPRLVERRSEPANGWLRGAAIREVAVRILASQSTPHAAIHYSDWLGLLERTGYGIDSRDPAATFLTQLNRSPVVTRTEQPGTYRLDFDAPARLRARLVTLNDELLALHQGQQTIEAIASTRSRRNEIVAEIDRISRQLDEAMRAVGSGE